MNHNRSGKFWNGKAAGIIVRVLAVALVAFAISGIASAQNDWVNTLQFEGGIGVIPVTGVAANGAVNLNVVRGVPPAGPWRIAALEAAVGPDGHIRVAGRGLLLAAGNGIGTNGGQSVHASLFCGPATSATEHDSTVAGVPLAADGDFRINDFLTPAPPVPCTNPVLLIRSVGGVWFAAGIPEQER